MKKVLIVGAVFGLFLTSCNKKKQCKEPVEVIVCEEDHYDKEEWDEEKDYDKDEWDKDEDKSYDKEDWDEKEEYYKEDDDKKWWWKKDKKYYDDDCEEVYPKKDQ